jgi:hypothetical protein
MASCLVLAHPQLASSIAYLQGGLKCVVASEIA